MNRHLQREAMQRAMTQLFALPKPVASFEPTETGKVFSFVKPDEEALFQIDLNSLGKFSPGSIASLGQAQERAKRNIDRFRFLTKTVGWWSIFCRGWVDQWQEKKKQEEALKNGGTNIDDSMKAFDPVLHEASHSVLDALEVIFNVKVKAAKKLLD